MDSGEDKIPPGDRTAVGTTVVDVGTMILQRRRPVKQMNQHVSTFSIYGGDMPRQISTHHFLHRLNSDFLQSAVYDSDSSGARLIGIEYIISDRLYENLPQDEQKLWHSHAYEVKSGAWIYPQMPEKLVAPELNNIAKTYGKFWCTWQVDRGDKLPIGPPELMMSPQAVDRGVIRPELVKSRDEKYKISTDELKHRRAEIAEPEWINPMADYWKQHGKCFLLDIVPVEMNRNAPFP
ncbi:PREDICTED: oil body-associated protein 2C [Tarenaya hassleriana]|uniref:oil body-associated protein 2C n=1 Tax=Tarenaya hassleriana TaxID=28532 RepID=UPI00053C596E|nr:PREDICTED: oil body-associated protein 2C [Tarenaya hassleriana]